MKRMYRKAAVAAISLVLTSPVVAHDPDHPELSKWYAMVNQPDTYGFGKTPLSCCGEGDAYWADEEHVSVDEYGKSHLVVTITDDRDDDKLHRLHVPIGYKYEVPETKVVGKQQKVGNPTGHAVVWLTGGLINGAGATPDRRQVTCYVPNNGF